MKKDAMNYMKGELSLMPVKAVRDVYFNLLKKSGKEVVRESLNNYSKEEVIYRYGKLRNKMMLG